MNNQEKGQVLQKKVKQKFKNNLVSYSNQLIVSYSNQLIVCDDLNIQKFVISKYSINKLTDKLHSRYVEESGVGHFTSDSATLAHIKGF